MKRSRSSGPSIRPATGIAVRERGCTAIDVGLNVNRLALLDLGRVDVEARGERPAERGDRPGWRGAQRRGGVERRRKHRLANDQSEHGHQEDQSDRRHEGRAPIPIPHLVSRGPVRRTGLLGESRPTRCFNLSVESQGDSVRRGDRGAGETGPWDERGLVPRRLCAGGDRGLRAQPVPLQQEHPHEDHGKAEDLERSWLSPSRRTPTAIPASGLT